MTAQRRFQLHEEWSRPADVAAFDVKGVGDWLARLEADQRIRDRDRFRLDLQGGLERFKKGQPAWPGNIGIDICPSSFACVPMRRSPIGFLIAAVLSRCAMN